MTSATLTRRAIAPLLVAGATLLLSACGGAGTDSAPSSEAGTTSVVAAFYPLQYAAQAVGGDTVSVTSLTPPGVEPHDLELTAAQVAEISQADVVLYIKGFQPAVDEAVAQQAADRAIDVSEGLALLSGDPAEGEINDPHVWLDPANMAAIGQAIATRLGAVDAESAATVSANASALSTAMADLDAKYAAGLSTCASTDLVVSHEAFGYLANAYGLTQVGISGLSPEAEPSPARMKEVADLVRTAGISTIYYESLVDPKVAQTIADETGATAVMLDPLEGLAPDSTSDYVSVMEANLATLMKGQNCG